MIDPSTYKVLGGRESYGDAGCIGIRILASSDKLADLDECDEINNAVYKAVENINDEITAIIAAREGKERAAQEREGLLACFEGQSIYVETIPNGYCSQGCCRHLPWFIVTTRVGRIKIGWRKRVIQIDWTDTVGTQTAETLFADENVTKGRRDIHAWGLEDAKRYITKILNTPCQP